MSTDKQHTISLMAATIYIPIVKAAASTGGSAEASMQMVVGAAINIYDAVADRLASQSSGDTRKEVGK